VIKFCYKSAAKFKSRLKEAKYSKKSITPLPAQVIDASKQVY